MATFIKKTKEEILRQALTKLERQTPIKATSPGSVARAFTEAVTTELSDYYDALDFNMAQTVLSTASARALDLLGDMYAVKRRTISDLSSTDRKLGSFYFYIDAPHISAILIPAGTKVYTSVDTFVGRQLGYETIQDATIDVGRTRVFVSIRPIFGDRSFAAGANSLITHSMPSPVGVQIRCTNPKAIAPQEGLESDENYRLRIIKAIRVASSGTEDALRFAALGVPGVRDVFIRQAPYGLGSFEVVMTPEEFNAVNVIRANVKARLDKVRPVGVRMTLIEPTMVPIDISASLVMANTTSFERNLIEGRADVSIRRYLNSLLSGDTLVYNRMIQAILDSSTVIIDVQFTRYAPNGREVVRKNFTPRSDEIMTPGRIDVTVASS